MSIWEPILIVAPLVIGVVLFVASSWRDAPSAETDTRLVYDKESRSIHKAHCVKHKPCDCGLEKMAAVETPRKTLLTLAQWRAMLRELIDGKKGRH